MKNRIKSIIAIALVLLLTSVFAFSASAAEYEGGDHDGTVHFSSANILGDVNDDLVLDVRDLVRLKKVVAELDNVKYNELNAELDGNSLAINGGDLVALRKTLLSI